MHDGKSFSVGYSKDNSGNTDHPDKTKPSVASEAERKVEEVIELLLDGYLDDVERYKSSGTW